MLKKVSIKILIPVILIVSILSLTGCNDINNESSNDSYHEQSSNWPEVWREDGSFFDDFSNGIDSNIWMIPATKWGYTNGGVTHQNISYTKDGIVVIAANGDYYDGPVKGLHEPGKYNDHGKRTGGILRSTHFFGPGSFEVRMKVVPRLGACSAIWTFFNDGPRNHEIDIELPGPGMFSFEYAGFTNYTTLRNNTSRKIRVPPQNDGNFHIYRFDWQTSPPQIDYYIDGKLYQSTNLNVPTVKKHFTVGVWFPEGWAGVPDFETNYMKIDWIKYTPFDQTGAEENPYDFPRTPEIYDYYPDRPSAEPVNNLFLNPRFERDLLFWEINGDAKLTRDYSTAGDYGIEIANGGEIIQEISSITQNIGYKMSFDIKTGLFGAAYVKIEYTNQFGHSLGVEPEIFKVSGFRGKNNTIRFTTNNDTRKIIISVFNEKNRSVYVDNFVLEAFNDTFLNIE